MTGIRIDVDIPNFESRASLGDVVEQIWGVSQGQHFLRGCSNWILLLGTLDWFEPNEDEDVYIQPPETGPSFVGDSLTEAQRVSLHLLREWWNAEIQNQLFSTAASEEIYRGSKAFDILENGGGAEGLPFIHKVQYTCDKFTIDNRLIDDTLISQSQYHEQLFYLWIVEFCLIEHPLKAELLHTQRKIASYMAAGQRVAWSCFERLVMGDQTHGPQNSGSDHAAFITSTGCPSPNLKRTFSTTIDQCPWLWPERYRGNEDNMNSLPVFLWDIMAGKLVLVSDLTQRPSYTVISHSWCRGIISDAPLIEVAGVPWLVSQNSQFEVQDLPLLMRIRAIADGFTPYLWIEIFCIPPETATAGFLPKIRAKELCRQAQIFRSATEGMIWFHSARDWRGLEYSVLWLAAQFLHESQGHFDGPLGFAADRLDLVMEQIESGACAATSLFEPYEYNGSQSIEAATQVGWFTSLWTLQEMYLRPDMRLVDRNWRTFSIGPQNLIMTLESLVSMAHCYFLLRFPTDPENPLENPVPRYSVTTVSLGPKSRWYRDTLGQWHTQLFEFGNLGHARIPRGVGEILVTFRRSKLDMILDPRHLNPLLMANQRYCVRRRAEAIMGITGCTSWYHDYFTEHGEPYPRGEKVLDRFPLPYLEEFLYNLGAQFFSTWRPIGEHCVKDVFHHHPDSSFIKVRSVGSMLPFCRSMRQSKEEWKFPLFAHDDPSVSTWSILPDGSCLVKDISIVAQHEPHSDEPAPPPCPQLLAEIEAHQCDVNGQCVNRLTGDLALFLRKYSPNHTIHAVALSCGPLSRDHVGILLQEVSRPAGMELLHIHRALHTLEDRQEDQNLLLKVGVFRLIGMAPMHTIVGTNVNWRVL